jgi:SAM-dependent methyltransferase
MVALGQVFTPAPVADLVLALALDGQPGGARILDPACGDGVFLARAAARGALARGVEIDPALAARAPGDVAVADFLDLPPPETPFDAVVGNPPYVRQELLGGVKARIAARLAQDWPGLSGWSARADLALAFIARALRFVKPGGRVAFVVSAAVLDAGRAALAALLDGRGRIAAVVASPRERWFADAAVHGVLLVLERDPTPAPTLCARLGVPIATAAARVRGLHDLAAVADVRRAPPGTPLGPLLRAPEAWLAAAAHPALVPLGAVAEVRRGATSGANDFFYLDAAAAARWRLEPRFVVPLLRTPRAIDAIALDPARLATRAFVCAEPRDRLPAGARAYVDAHEHVAARPTLAARPRWWSLPARPARLFLTKAYSARFVQPLAARPVVPDQRVYSVAPRPGVALDLLCAVLNGSLAALAIESLGRASLGEGALELSVGDAERLPILDPRRLRAAAVRRALAPLLGRRMGDVFAERDAVDRRALDQALAPAGLEALAWGRALAETVAERLARAEAVAGVTPPPTPARAAPAARLRRRATPR